ncbi:SIR2 family protein [Paenarthrobacter sp. NPDC092416]|uniref:SIR2 family protein n=1 Tax=Paenarthrobacter sp. NPDC092416 TaxID=3364386 RepID=UPI0038115447
MSAPDLTAEMMEQFRSSGAENHSTILLGAGASTTSGLPDWDTFATRLLRQSNSVPDDETANLLLSRQDPLLVVEAARAAAGDKWEQKLRKALYEGVTQLDPSPLHLAAVGHLLTGNGDTSLVTLNFDTLLESAICEEEASSAPVSAVDGADYGQQRVVTHLHGVISPTSSVGVILTLNDFTDLIANANSWQYEYLEKAVSRGALIIAGTSYRDPDVRQWLHLALKGKPKDHAALVLLARQAFSLSKPQFQKTQRALSDQWRAVGLEPVLLQDHADAAQIIQELRYVHREDYEAPQERASQIWAAHATNFATLQETYVEELNKNSTDLRDVLDVDRLNVSLWIADGVGKLTRWAAQDRLYRDLATLRTVDTGHDSPWIAGQSLGSDTLLFKNLETENTRQWKSVLALPIPVPHPTMPTLSAAVLTIGLPLAAEKFESSKFLWGEKLMEIADDWGDQLSAVAFPASGRTL